MNIKEFLNELRFCCCEIVEWELLLKSAVLLCLVGSNL